MKNINAKFDLVFKNVYYFNFPYTSFCENTNISKTHACRECSRWPFATAHKSEKK